jgi:hypothetical protein
MCGQTPFEIGGRQFSIYSNGVGASGLQTQPPPDRVAEVLFIWDFPLEFFKASIDALRLETEGNVPSVTQGLFPVCSEPAY